VLRIGRTAAYLLARQWEATDGAEGLPVVRLGRLLRVPVHQLERLAAGDLELPARPSTSPIAGPSASARPQPGPPAPSTSRQSTRPRHDAQASLFPEASTPTDDLPLEFPFKEDALAPSVPRAGRAGSCGGGASSC
jgi:hypothetical protein